MWRGLETWRGRDPTLLADKTVALAGRPLGIFVRACRDRHHLAVITFPTQPAEKGAFEHLGIETVGLGAPMFARYGYARCVDNVGLDVARPEPTRQPEPVTAGLESDSDAFDPVSRLLCLRSPSMQQLQQCVLVDPKLLQRLTLDPGHDAGNEPARLAQLDDGNQRLVRIEGCEASGHSTSAWGAPSVHISADGCNILAAAPIVSALALFRRRPHQRPRDLLMPASE
jgi:hypothetical protein